MMLLRLSGHSGAGKSRLTTVLPRFGVTCPRAILYTSRAAREGEAHGRDYYFLSRGAIAALPSSDFYVGPVREMFQAVDLSQLESDLKSNSLVLVEIFADLWPGLERRIAERLGSQLRTASVCMTAVDPKTVLAQPDEQSRARFIQHEVEQILQRRAKDTPDKIKSRAKSAVAEVWSAVGPDGSKLYSRVFHSAPEGPDGQDEWTSEAHPVGRAKQVLDEFVAFVQGTEK
jgi:hypothetical protein